MCKTVVFHNAKLKHVGKKKLESALLTLVWFLRVDFGTSQPRDAASPEERARLAFRYVLRELAGGQLLALVEALGLDDVLERLDGRTVAFYIHVVGDHVDPAHGVD